jgi:hypothetical protein
MDRPLPILQPLTACLGSGRRITNLDNEVRRHFLFIAITFQS